MAKSITEIKNMLLELSIDEKMSCIESLRVDGRKGVQALISKVEKEQASIFKEDARLLKLTEYEQDLINRGYKNIVGIDEVGRGPLAGPVVTCAVRLKDLTIYRGIDDSKKVNLKHRLRLFEEINYSSIEVAYGIASHEEIDELNILNATKLAMKRAVENLSEKPDHLLIDAVKLDDIDIDQTSIIKGDEKSVSIAAASIMAKVTRDNMMIQYHELYPEYDFMNNKGYGTAAHYAGLNGYGLTPIHRRTFVKDFL